MDEWLVDRLGVPQSQLGLQLLKDVGELVRCRRRLRPLDDEALLIRIGWLRDNMEMDVVHELSTQARPYPRNPWSAMSVGGQAILLSAPDARCVHYSTTKIWIVRPGAIDSTPVPRGGEDAGATGNPAPTCRIL